MVTYCIVVSLIVVGTVVALRLVRRPNDAQRRAPVTLGRAPSYRELETALAKRAGFELGATRVFDTHADLPYLLGLAPEDRAGLESAKLDK
jgi:hypothetical protein